MTIKWKSYNFTRVDMNGKVAVSKPNVSSLFWAEILSCNPADDMMGNLLAELSEYLLIAAFLFSPS